MNSTTAYVAASRAVFSATSGRESASATEIPPLKPPQVNIGMVPGANFRKSPNTITNTGPLTAARRATSTSGTAVAISPPKAGSNRSTKTSGPISRNRIELSISSTSVQKPNSYRLV